MHGQERYRQETVTVFKLGPNLEGTLANTIDKKWSQLSATLFSDLSEGIFAFGEELDSTFVL